MKINNVMSIFLIMGILICTATAWAYEPVQTKESKTADAVSQNFSSAPKLINDVGREVASVGDQKQNILNQGTPSKTSILNITSLLNQDKPFAFLKPSELSAVGNSVGVSLSILNPEVRKSNAVSFEMSTVGLTRDNGQSPDFAGLLEKITR